MPGLFVKERGLLWVHLWVGGQAIIYNLMTCYKYLKKWKYFKLFSTSCYSMFSLPFLGHTPFLNA